MNHWVFMRVSIYNFFVFWKLNIEVWLIMETTMSCWKWYGEIDMEGSLWWYCFVSRETVESCTPWAESPRQQVDLAFNVFFLIYFFIRVSVSVSWSKHLYHMFLRYFHGLATYAPSLITLSERIQCFFYIIKLLVNNLYLFQHMDILTLVRLRYKKYHLLKLREW